MCLSENSTSVWLHHSTLCCSPPNSPFEQHRHMSLRTRDSVGFAPISTPPNGLHELRRRMYPHSRDSLGSSPIATLPNGLHEQHRNMSFQSRDGSWPIVILPNASTSRIGTCVLVPGTALVSCPFQYLQMASTSSLLERVLRVYCGQ